ARSSLLRRAFRHAASVVAALAALAPRLVRLAHHDYSDRLLAMLRVRYTAWDGTQEIRLEADRVFEKLSEYLSFTDDVQQAFDWLLHQGLEWEEGVRVMGLDDFLEQLREAMRSRYREVNLREAFRELREKLEELLDLERDALDRAADPKAAARKRELLDRLSPRLSEALEQLRDYAFEDDEARRALEDLLEELDDIRDLENFQRRYGDLFQGPQSLSYREAVGLLRDRPGGHQTDHRGSIDLRPEETKRYQHGDPLVLDLVRTLKKALTRRPGTPLDVHPEDFEVHAATHSATTSTVLLLDMSWS